MVEQKLQKGKIVEADNATKRRIIETAIKLINESDYDSVTLNDICRASGVNKTTFYYYLQSKEDLLKDYYDISYVLEPHKMAKIMAAQSSLEQLWLLLGEFIDYYLHPGAKIAKQVLISNLSKSNGTFKVSKERQDFFEMLTVLIEKAQQEGYVKNSSDPAVLVSLLNHSLHGTVVTWCMTGATFDFKKTFRRCFEALLDVAQPYKRSDDSDFCGLWKRSLTINN